MKLRVYTWFPYQSSAHCNEVNDITPPDRWVISARVHFTKKIYLFPGKFSKSFNGIHMKAVVRGGNWIFTTKYV